MSPPRRARVVVKADAASARPLFELPVLGDATRRRMAKDAVAARDFARRVTDAARAEADAIVSRARAEAARLERDAADEARAREVARLSAAFLLLRAEDERRAERDLDRIVQLATVLAERLLGEAIERDPARVVALARQALLEARGARRVLIEACPLDVETLTRHVEGIGFADGALELRPDPTLSRGSLRVHTNLGSLDAQLTPQLERLAEALRDALT